jgi:20S proteasome alpha/beta subunit
MTYIAAFHCRDGIVVCADTQETIQFGEEAEKQHSEKLYVIDDYSYPLAIAGAGLPEPIEAFAQEVRERAKKEKPDTVEKLVALVKAAIAEVYASDMPVSVNQKEYRTAQYLIAAKPSNGPFTLLKVTGKRVFLVTEKKAIIGYATAPNNALLKRFFTPDLPMQQAVMLAIFLVLQSKAINEGVGFDTQVAVVTEKAATLEESPYVANSEQRVSDFMRLTDALFLASIDNSISPSKFPEILAQFGIAVGQLRERFLNETASIMLGLMFSGKSGLWTYPKIFQGAVVEVGTFGVKAREDTPEELERRRQMMNALKEKSNQLANAQFIAMIGTRTPLYLGEETIQVRGTAGFFDVSGSS